MSCKRKWTEKDKADFFQGCMKKGLPSLGEARAKKFCTCFTQKIIEHYPNAKDLGYLQYDTAVNALSRECQQP